MTHDEVWWGMMRYDEVWWGMMRYDEVWWGMMRHDEAWWSMMRHDEVWWGMMRHDEVWWGMMRYDEVWWGMIRYDESICLEGRFLISCYCHCVVGWYWGSINLTCLFTHHQAEISYPLLRRKSWIFNNSWVILTLIRCMVIHTTVIWSHPSKLSEDLYQGKAPPGLESVLANLRWQFHAFTDLATLPHRVILPYNNSMPWPHY